MNNIKPQEVSEADIAFGGDINKLLPELKDIPEEFKKYNGNKWNRVFSTWFFCGLKEAVFKVKPGIDKDKALRHIKAIMCSWAPKHEHKKAGVAYLLSLWFEDVKYKEDK